MQGAPLLLAVPLNGGFVDRGSLGDPNPRELRTFAVGERFTTRCCPIQVAFKPAELCLSEARVPTAAWCIHDVRVDRRSQVDGDELGGELLPNGSPTNRAIVSGWDTIAIGAPFEVDVSLRPWSGVERASFFASLLGTKVDPGRGVAEYSGRVRLRGACGELVAATCDGPARVPRGESAWFVARTKESAFRPDHIAIDRHWDDWEISDMSLCDRTQFSQSGDIPGRCFHPDAIDTFVSLDLVTPDEPLAIRARYVGSDPRGGRFGAFVRGAVIT